MNRMTTFRRNLALIPLVLAVLALVFVYCSVFVWILMTAIFLLLIWEIAEIMFDNFEPTCLFLVGLTMLIILELGLSPNLLGDVFSPETISWLGGLAATGIPALFIFRLKGLGLSELIFIPIWLCIVLLWTIYPVLWEWYFLAAVGILMLILLIFSFGAGEAFAFLSKNNFRFGDLFDNICWFLSLEACALLFAILLFGWRWEGFAGVFGIGIIGILVGYLCEYQREFKTNKNKER